MQYTAENILVHPIKKPNDPDLILSVTPDEAGWDYISFQARRLAAGPCSKPYAKLNHHDERGSQMSDLRKPCIGARLTPSLQLSTRRGSERQQHRGD